MTIASGNVAQAFVVQSPSPMQVTGVPPSGCAPHPTTLADEQVPFSAAESNAVSTFHVPLNASPDSAAQRFCPSCMYTTGKRASVFSV